MLLSRAFERSLPHFHPAPTLVLFLDRPPARSLTLTHTTSLVGSHRELYSGFWWSFTKHKLLTIRIQFVFHRNVMSFECVHNFVTRYASISHWDHYKCDTNTTTPYDVPHFWLLDIQHVCLHFFFQNLFVSQSLHSLTLSRIVPFFRGNHLSVAWNKNLDLKKADFYDGEKETQKVNMRRHCSAYYKYIIC